MNVENHSAVRPAKPSADALSFTVFLTLFKIRSLFATLTQKHPGWVPREDSQIGTLGDTTWEGAAKEFRPSCYWASWLARISCQRRGRLFDCRTFLRRRMVFRSEEHTSELQSRRDLVCRLLLEKKKKK